MSPGDEQALLQVVIVDDHPLIRSVLTRTLNHEPDLEVVSPVASAEAALETFAAAMPALMLVDYSMPGMNGAELIEQLKRTHPDLP